MDFLDSPPIKYTDLSGNPNSLVRDFDTLLTLSEHDFHKHQLQGEANHDDLKAIGN